MNNMMKLSLLLIFAATINITGCFGIGLILALVLPLFMVIFKRELSKYSLLMLPLVYVSICQANKDLLFIFLSLSFTYVLRCAILDDRWNNRKEWIISFILSIGCYFVNREYCVIPLIALVLTIPVVRVELHEKLRKPKIAGILFLLLNLIVLVICLGFDVKDNKKTAYLMHGNWANAIAEYKIDDLRNETVYSYSEFVDLIGADTITRLDNIRQYEELWIITPTTPFTEIEIATIENWVANGGNLILVSDHTDLYGHARCINQLARKFKYEVDYSVSMNYNNDEIFRTCFGTKTSIKGGNTTKSRGGFPLIANYVWTEPAYYANNNNFGPVVPSGNDDYGLRVTAETKPYGKGNVVMLCDSTVFANFCLFQPNIPKLIKFVRMYHPFGRLLFFLPIVLLALLLLLLVGDEKWYICLFLLVLCSAGYLKPTQSLHWGDNPQIWTGESEHIYEGCPFANISTAYSLARLTGRKPKWENRVANSENDVIYVGEQPPLNKKWRWVRITDVHYEYDWKLDTSKFAPLYDALNMSKVKTNYAFSFDSIMVADIYNDRVMNTWWYNDGISKSRLQRIKSWISWLKKDTTKEKCMPLTAITDQRFECVLKRKNKEPIVLWLPKPLAEDGEVYIGNGLTCSVYYHDGKHSLVGLGQNQENSDVDAVWVIDYK